MLIGSDGFCSLKAIRQSRSIFIPEGVVSRALFNCCSECFSTLVIVSLDEVKSSKDHEDVSIRRLHLVGFHERSLDGLEVLKVSLSNFRELTVIRMRLEPILETSLSLFLIKLVSTTDSKAEKTIQIIGICLISIFERNHREFVHVILLVKLT